MKSVRSLSILVTVLTLAIPQVASADRGGSRHFRYPSHSVYRDHSALWWLLPPLIVLSTLPAYRSPPPVVIQQMPPPVVLPSPAPVTAMPAPPPYWYFCASANAYYPYVQDCAEGWSLVPATPSTAPAN